MQVFENLEAYNFFMCGWVYEQTSLRQGMYAFSFQVQMLPSHYA